MQTQHSAVLCGAAQRNHDSCTVLDCHLSSQCVVWHKSRFHYTTWSTLSVPALACYSNQTSTFIVSSSSLIVHIAYTAIINIFNNIGQNSPFGFLL